MIQIGLLLALHICEQHCEIVAEQPDIRLICILGNFICNQALYKKIKIIIICRELLTNCSCQVKVNWNSKYILHVVKKL